MVERTVQEEAIDWKVLFKIGENWRNGACFSRLLHPEVANRLVRSVCPSNV